MGRGALRHLFIINRHAGKKESWKTISSQLDALRVPNLSVRYTSCRGDATAIAREFVGQSDDFARIYACGGDGTLNEVIRGVYDLENCAVAPVPIGSGNDFIRSFPFEREDFLNIKSLIGGETLEVDLLRCGEHISCNSVTIGYDCAVAKNVDKFKRLRLITSSFAYKLSIFYCLINGRKHLFKIITDGREIKNDGTYLLSVCAKGKFYGGGIKCSPKADNSDGYIDFMCVKTVGVLKFVSLLPTFVKGGHIDNPRFDFVEHKKCRTVEYISERETEIGVDGEIIPVRRAKIEVLPKAVKIIVPNKMSGSV